MQDKRMKILLLSHASLSTGFVVGSHHIAQNLSTSHSVKHVSSPVTLAHLFKGKVGRKKLLRSFFPKKPTGWSFTDYIPFVPFPYGYNSKLDSINNWFILVYFKLFSIPINNDLVLIDQPLFASLLPKLTSKKIIYRPTDIYKLMGGDRFVDCEIKSIELADAIIATSQEVLEALPLASNNSKPTLVINNGVDYEYFANHSHVTREGCVYAGAVDFRFDIEEVIALAASLPSIRFDIYGPISIDLTEFSIPNNLTFKGAVSYGELPNILAQYTVGIIPMNDHPSNDGRSPMKFYEYLAAGLIVIVRYRERFSAQQCRVIQLFSSHEEAVDLIENANNEVANSYSQECLAKAKEQSWSTKTHRILNFSEGV